MATHAEPEAVRRPQQEEEREIENLLREESAHGERLVSLVRALTFTLAAIVSAAVETPDLERPRIIQGLPARAASVPIH
jgi:hypothetical protein